MEYTTIKSIILALAITFCSFANATEKPNILFCIADDASYPHFGANGCSWVKTPNFDRVAKDGLRFTNAYTPNAKCTPSRSCVITGRNPWQLEAAAKHRCFFPDKFKSVCESLRDNGYETAYTGKGWSPGVEPKGRMLVGELINVTGSKPANGISDIDYAASFGKFLKQRNAQKPFFFWYGCLEPHRGYENKSGVNKANAYHRNCRD